MPFTYSKPFIIKLIVCYVLLALIGGSLFWYFYNKEHEVAENQQVQDSTETANWKTYQNDELGFEFDYPKEVNLEAIKSGTKNCGEIQYGNGDPDVVSLAVSFAKSSISYTNINVYLVCRKLTEKENYSVGGPFASDYSIKNVTINGRESYQQHFSTTSPGNIHWAIKIPFDASHYISVEYYYRYDMPNTPNADVKLIEWNKILSTLKFIDSAETADWKTYKSDKFGFEFKHPGDWSLWDANPFMGFVVLYPESKSEQVINKTISTSDEITFGMASGKFVKFSAYEKITINDKPWFVRALNNPFDGGTENGLEYLALVDSDNYIDISTGVSNKELLLKILSTFKFTK